MKDKLKKQLEMLKKSSKVDALLERGDIEEQALLNSSEDLRPADESHTYELLESSKEQLSVLSARSRSKSSHLSKTRPAKSRSHANSHKQKKKPSHKAAPRKQNPAKKSGKKKRR